MTLENIQPSTYQAIAYGLFAISFLISYLYTRKSKYINVGFIFALCLAITGIAFLLFQLIPLAPVIMVSGIIFYSGVVATAGAGVNFVRF